MYVINQQARAVPFPWHRPCIFISPVAPPKAVELPYSVLKKNFMSCIVDNIDTVAVVGTPTDWNAIDTIRCAVLL